MTPEETLKQLDEALAYYEYEPPWPDSYHDFVIRAAEQYARLLREEIDGVSKCVPVEPTLDMAGYFLKNYGGVSNGLDVIDFKVIYNNAIKAAPSRLMED